MNARNVGLVSWGLCALAVGCSFHPCGGPSTELVAGLRSHADPVTVKSILRPCDWTVLEEPRRNPEERRPRFDVLAVSAGRCSHVPEATRLELQFLNDRLMRVSLITPEPKAYLDSLGHQPGWSRAGDGSLLRGPATRVWSAVNWKNEPYVMWEDTCLAAEERAWIEKYAALGALEGEVCAARRLS